MQSITDLSAHSLSLAVHRGELTCVQMMKEFLQRIDQLNPVYNAIISRVDEEELLRMSAEKDQQLSRGASQGWMHGLPIAVKDLALTQGIRTTMGSPILKDFIATQDSLVVQRMKNAGAIVIGKTNTPEFGLGSHTFNEIHGVTVNAYDPTKSAGGSSGGAAVALALNMLPIADGSDFMGSLRNPAGWNHVYGMRPSQGRVPSYPATDHYIAQLSTEGPMARNVLDLAKLLQTQSGPDARVPLSISSSLLAEVPSDSGKGQTIEEYITTKPLQVRIGWLADLNGYLPMQPDIVPFCEKALNRFALHSQVVQVDLIQANFQPERVWSAWCTWRKALVGARLKPYTQNPQHKALLKPEALWEFEQSESLSSQDLMSASAERSAFFQQILKYFDTFDILALPSAQVWPFDKTLRYPQRIVTSKGSVSMDTYHRWMEVVIYATFAGLPCICVPAGFNENGLAMGIQLIGKPQSDAQLLRIAHFYESHLAKS
jgi:amidase